MSKVILAMFMSLDGFIEGPNGEFIPPDWSGDLQRYWADDNTDAAGTLLYGRVNFQFNAGFWQGAAADESNSAEFRAFARKMNSLPKVVFSTTLETAAWENTRLVKEHAAEEVARLKQQPGKDIAIFGSSDLATSLLRDGLLDEVRVIVNPVILGSGKRLFEGIDARVELKLSRTQTFHSGNVLLCYQPVAQ